MHIQSIQEFLDEVGFGFRWFGFISFLESVIIRDEIQDSRRRLSYGSFRFRSWFFIFISSRNDQNGVKMPVVLLALNNWLMVWSMSISIYILSFLDKTHECENILTGISFV